MKKQKPGHSKARQAKRAQTLDRRRGRKPGVKLGPTPLPKHKMRWEVAVYGMLVRTRRASPIRAAEIASIFNNSTEITAGEITAAGVLVSFDYTRGRGERIDARKNRRDKILREAPKMIRAATDEDQTWLEQAMLTLDVAFSAVGLRNPELLLHAMRLLKRLDRDASKAISKQVTSEMPGTSRR
jgi:hypothetical protein